MACKLKDIKTCGFAPPGVLRIALLEHEDLQGLLFEGLTLVSEIYRTADFVELTAGDQAKYTTQGISGGFTHTLETFVPGLRSEASEELWKATKKHFFVLFLDGSGKTIIFGYDSPASLSFQGGTDNGAGFSINLTCSSKYPTLQALPSALVWRERAEWEADLSAGVFCEIDFL